MSDPTLFRPIGEVVDATDKLRDDIEAVDQDRLVQESNKTGGGEDADDEEREVQQIESLCMECGEQGMTRMLLTVIPYFREVIVMSFRCEHCGNSNTEIQSAGEIQPKGCVHTVHVLDSTDLDRQLVKSNTATVTIPELQLTIPASRGQLTNIEGLISDTARDLAMDQPVRKVMEPEAHDKIQAIIDQLKSCLEGDDEEDKQYERREKKFTPFTLVLDDPAGNSFIQFLGTTGDVKWSMRVYGRTRQQNVMLGLVSADEEPQQEKSQQQPLQQGGKGGAGLPEESEARLRMDGSVIPEEIYAFPGSCGSCGHMIDTLMQKVNIPHFKDIIIMSTNCEHCGYRDNEVKSGGAISEKGKRITLKVEDDEDLSRDILKSETCGLEIPEIDLVLQPGTLGGRFTTLEGMLNQIYDELSTKVFRTGDSTLKVGAGADSEAGGFEKFLGGLKSVMAAEKPFTLILDDPVANSYLQNLYAPDDDPNMEIVSYERSHEQNEELGINDMVLTGYENEHPEEPSK